MIRFALALLLACAAAPAAAHPHVFVQAEIEILTNESRKMTGVRLTWTYDDYFSLLLMADLGIDLDSDMVLTPEEEDILRAGVLDWPEDFEGDLYVTQGDQPVALGSKEEHTVAFIDGVVSETHVRPLVYPAGNAAPTPLQIYDPDFYVAYEVIDIHVSGGDGCQAELQKADLDSAYKMVEVLLGGRAASDVGPNEEFPPVGKYFADTVVITCTG
ncbi:MAG: DUF1007 family protein [Rhodobacterales bacterium]|nr:DUF1007 family protein [Rhodobacterales bacterium]